MLEENDYDPNTICTEKTVGGLIKIAKKERTCECIHLSKNRKCEVYHSRPLQCLNYDCRDDSRIWVDFNRNILNTEFIKRLKSHKI